MGINLWYQTLSLNMLRNHSSKNVREINLKSLTLSLILGIFFLVPNIYAALATNVLTLWTNCFLSIGYILASLASLIAYKAHHNYQLERRINLAIAGFLLIIIAFIWVNIYLRIQQGFTPGSFTFALSLLGLYVVINSYMFFRTYYYGKIANSHLMLTQANIYLVKLLLNFIIIGTLLLTHYFSKYTWAKYFDPCCSFLLSGFIFIKAKELYFHQPKIFKLME